MCRDQSTVLGSDSRISGLDFPTCSYVHPDELPNVLWLVSWNANWALQSLKSLLELLRRAVVTDKGYLDSMPSWPIARSQYVLPVITKSEYIKVNLGPSMLNQIPVGSVRPHSHFTLCLSTLAKPFTHSISCSQKEKHFPAFG